MPRYSTVLSTLGRRTLVAQGRGRGQWQAQARYTGEVCGSASQHLQPGPSPLGFQGATEAGIGQSQPSSPWVFFGELCLECQAG